MSKRLLICAALVFIGIKLGCMGFDSATSHIQGEFDAFHEKVAEQRDY